LLCFTLINLSSLQFFGYSVADPAAWNSLSLGTHSAPTLELFKTKLKTELFLRSYTWLCCLALLRHPFVQICLFCEANCLWICAVEINLVVIFIIMFFFIYIYIYIYSFFWPSVLHSLGTYKNLWKRFVLERLTFVFDGDAKSVLTNFEIFFRILLYRCGIYVLLSRHFIGCAHWCCEWYQTKWIFVFCENIPAIEHFCCRITILLSFFKSSIH